MHIIKGHSGWVWQLIPAQNGATEDFGRIGQRIPAQNVATEHFGHVGPRIPAQKLLCKFGCEAAGLRDVKFTA